jgi:crotonobetainyl-CoA:carnitine CoA-transferase CaiB-like acyl-CoA transferase
VTDEPADIAPSADSEAAPLAGLRVIDMTIWMAGPVTGMLLADLGADVVKVESAAGDPTRAHTAPTAGATAETGTSISYATFNRNKRSISLDLTAQADRELFDRMIDRADVFITNMSPSTIAKLQIDEQTLHDRNPRLVHVRGAGLGVTGPRANDLAQDMTGMAYAGLLFTLSPDPQEPFAPPGALNDVITGTYLVGGVLAALIRRGRTGRGETVSSSLLQSALWTQLGLVGSVANTVGASTNGRPRSDPRNPLLNQYRAGDGRWIAVAAINARAWDAFVTGAGIEHLVSDPRFSTFEAAVTNSQAMRAALDEHFATAPAEHWLGRLREHGVWCGPANHLEDVLTDEHIAAEGYLATLDDGRRTVAMPFTLDGFTPGAKAGPALNADREQILRDWAIEPG